MSTIQLAPYIRAERRHLKSSVVRWRWGRVGAAALLIVLVGAMLAGCAELRNANSDPPDFFAHKERWSGGGAP